MTVAKVLLSATEQAIAEVQRRTKTDSYFDDPVAWARDVAGIHLWSKQREIARSIVDNKNVAVKAGHGVGKALSLDTPLPTPTGWTTMGGVQPGDYLLDEQGNPTLVIAVSDTWKEDTYRVTFDDGTFVDAAAQHEWNVIDIRHRPKRAPVSDWRDRWDATTIKETHELAKSVEFAGQKRWRVPLTKPLDLPAVRLPIDPYVFGAWLGDGASHGAQIASHVDDVYIRDRFVAEGYPMVKLSGKYAWSFADNGKFVSHIRALGVRNNKHIPVSYLRSGIHQRRELLRGILDTDGHIDARGVVTLDLCSETLARGVAELVRSLGGRVTIKPRPATLNGRVVGTRWRMSIRVVDFNPFALPRKADRWKAPVKQASRHTQRTIVSVEQISTVETKCVHVDSDNHLFLAGEGMVPTHNSFLLAVLICWWVDTRAPNVFVASTAPSNAQVGAILWREIRKLKAKITERYKQGLVDHELPGYVTADNKWKLAGGQELGFGRKPPDNKEDDRFQGLHDGYVLAVGDEAVGLTESMIDALSNITSNEGSKRVLIANPTNPASYFGKIFREDTGAWALHTISVLDSPNFTDEKNELDPETLAKLTGPEYVEDKRKEYGEDSPRFRSRVLGEFAYDLGDTLIKPEDVAVAVDTVIIPSGDDPVVLGVDVARFGKDASVIYSNQGGRLRYVDSKFESTRTTEIANWVHRWAVDLNATEVRVDAHGVGGGVVDILVGFDRKYIVIGMNSNGATPDNKQWHNARAYWWDMFRSDLRRGVIDIDPEDIEFEKLLDELTMVEYKFSRQSGGLLIESKDDMKKRGVKSPDFADSAIYASADMSSVVNDPLAGLGPGDKIRQSADEALGEVPGYLRIMGSW